MSRIGIIGTGHIGAPIARFLARKGHEVMVTRRNEAVSAQLVAEVGAAVGEPQEVVDASDVLILCLRPDVAKEVLAPLEFRAGQIVLSMMMAITRDDLLAICAPADRIVQTIPLGFLEQGGCPLAAFGDTEALTAFFEPENHVVPVTSETALNAHFAICAFVPGVLELMATSAAWLGERTGDPKGAAFFTSQLLGTFLHLMDKDTADHLATERDALATTGSISLQMIEALRAGGVNDELSDALGAVEQRLNAT